MSLPFCLTNPKLRYVPTVRGCVTLEITADGYDVWRAGVKLGTITKTKTEWLVGQKPFKTRKLALDHLVSV